MKIIKDYKQQFIQFCLENDIIRFGKFTLKSGRKSPYFFNAGLFNSGEVIAKLGEFYAVTIQETQINYDLLFGPAYKGIPLAVATAIALSRGYNINKPFCFNRKEAKSHGEGGSLVGAPLRGDVLIIDDVITAGTAIRESLNIIKTNGARVVGVIVALNRQERGSGQLSAIEELQRDHNIKVFSIIDFGDILDFLQQSSEFAPFAEKVIEYRSQYGEGQFPQ